MLALADPKKGEKGVDLGSGDGRIVIAFAKKGVVMTGYELDPSLIVQSRQALQERSLTSATIEAKDFWEADLSLYSIITIYPMPDVMDILETKLKKETKKGTRILTNYYQLPTWKLTSTKDHIYLYIK